MPQDPEINRQFAYLNITGYGPSLDITKRIGIEPDEEWSEGDVWKEGHPYNSKRFFTFWKLNSGLLETEDLNLHIEELLRQIKRKRSEIQSLVCDYEVKITCVSYNTQSFGFELDFDLQRQLTSFGIRLEFDFYNNCDPHILIYDLKQQLENAKAESDLQKHLEKAQKDK